MMNILVLKTEQDYNEASLHLTEIFHFEPNTSEFNELDLLTILIMDYKDKHYQIPEPEAFEIIKIKRHEMGIKNKDLEVMI